MPNADTAAITSEARFIVPEKCVPVFALILIIVGAQSIQTQGFTGGTPIACGDGFRDAVVHNSIAVVRDTLD